MLKPAILYKEILQNKIRNYYDTEDMFFETGSISNMTPEISDNDPDTFNYVMLDDNDEVIGFLSFKIDWYASSAYYFTLISFDRGNPIIGLDLKQILNTLINKYKLHRLEWRMVGGNPIEDVYDKFVKKYNGNKHILQDAIKDRCGNYRDFIIYEIILNTEREE